MSVNLNNESDFELPKNFLDECDQLADFVLLQEQAPLTAVLSVTFVGDSEMATLNQEHRSKEGPTDVLSFPCDDISQSGAKIAENAIDDDPTSIYWADFDAAEDAAPILLGDVVIAPYVAAVQAEELNKNFFDEVRLLLVHGILHLLGYDHEGNEEQAGAMETREKEILSDWANLACEEDNVIHCGGGCCG
ncbi:MAG: rRNA maturation RNase YbeY [Coriobacteriia bacterium]|nr:rRNA maturation RNase YbeY [Coriobacteriia bacterium]MCL2870694.1 rRNA maturation RNase YbeY [Coriobacteriia bacterium]